MAHHPAAPHATVKTQVDDGVLIITLDRPEAMNAINRDLSNSVATAMRRADEDPAIKAVIICSAHPKVFCAGADLESVSRGIPLFAQGGPNAPWGLAGCTSKTPEIPVIAAIEGLALGGGFEIALAADILIASSSASFGLPEVQVGLIAGAGGTVRLPRQIPQKVALDLMLTGERLPAERAAALGLVSRLVEPGQALSAATEVGARIAGNAPLAVKASKSTALDLIDGVEREEIARWERNGVEFKTVLSSQDAQEGPSAFTEKRPPRWVGQ